MIKQVDTKLITEKFATLIEMLYVDGNISLANITDKIITDSYFELFEQNRADLFLYKSAEDYAKEAFNVQCYKTRKNNDCIYWAATQYMNIFLNCNVALQEIALQCPLEEMCSHFVLYHEMSPQKLIDEFKNNEQKRSILLLLRKKSGISVKELSYLTGITEHTLRYYEKDNENLFKASFSNILKFEKIFNVSTSLFVPESDFVPYSKHLWNIPEFKDAFVKNLKGMPDASKIEIDDDLYLHSSYFNEEVIDAVLSKHSKTLFVNETAYFAFKKNKKIDRIFINDRVLSKLIKDSIKDVTKEVNELLF